MIDGSHASRATDFPGIHRPLETRLDRMLSLFRALGLGAVLVAALCICTVASAQPLAIGERGQTQGVGLPPTGAALADQATAFEVNPAGLDAVLAPQLYFVHERNLRLDALGDGLYFAGRLFDTVGAGLAFQWVRVRGQAAYRKTSVSFALGDSMLSLGATYNLFGSPDDLPLDKLTTFDAGILFRPARALSVGASVRDLDATRFRGAPLPRRYDLGLGLRPFGDRVTLGADLLLDETTMARGVRLSYSASVEPIDGLVIHAGLAHGPGVPGGEVLGQVAVTLNGKNVGATYAGGGTPILEGTAHLLQLRLSKGATRGLAPRPNPWVTIDLHALLSPQKGSLLSLLPQEARAPYLEALALLRRLSEDPKVDGVVVRVAELDDIGNAKVEELRDALEGVARSGKRLFALLTEGGDSELYLATAAEKIFTVPQATLLINGFSSTALFLGDALGKAGVTVDVARVGEFKNAPDEFTRSSMSPAQKEAMGAYLDGIYSRYLAAVGKARSLSKEKLEEALSHGILSPRAAKEAGLVDDVLYPDELQEVLNKAAGHTVDLVSDYGPSPALAKRWGERPRIAVVNVEGTIADGTSRADPLGAVQIAGAETILKALEAAEEDASVLAIVLRVDSPGGSGAASDLLWRAARKLKERKPIVASMGDYAASGGYYIAMAADEIVAEPSTLTGSIGVFALKPSFGPLMGKLGINTDVLKRGERADLFSLARPWTEGEQKAMQRYVDDFYDTFITKVAESRKLEKSKVDAISRGRVWSGAAAKDLGLVDHLGGLSEAIGRARARANLAPGAEVEVVLLGGEGGLFSLAMAQEKASGGLTRALGDVAVALGLPLVDLPAGPLAMLPFRLRVK